MEKELTIQEIAKLTGLSVHTLRYYERIGLLDHVARTNSGYRKYSDADRAWIEFLNRLRATGMTIRKMQQFADLRRKGSATIHERRVILEEHQAEVRMRLLELQSNLESIEHKIVHYKELEEDELATK
ncbi:MerR family transcriptional regulator [Paenibacillus sediminis]|uniref:DNA-binding transcriptional MerR regulator n=1 Tax=Paenibacillus sediminis TaxID=664909 RepID=A0ABS4H4T4_9BACL|nr:MerR family transcriptional regulator [Paenibacillus sediminis]MBP1937549.1 DNA-binding transcriptional MerR regulator [Paenibacillus sediminis]